MTAGSLADRVAARREERVTRRSSKFVLPVPGYEDLLAGRYQVLSFEQKREIQLRHDKIGDDPADEVAAAADMLINACTDLLEVTGKDGDAAYKPLGKRWTSDAIRTVFAVDLPERTTARQALIAAVGSEEVMEMFGAYAREADRILAEGEEAAQGESEPSVEG